MATNPKKSAPLELISQFLKDIKAKHYESALKLSNEILIYEPHNSVILSYKPVLNQMIEANTPSSTSEAEEETDSGTEESDEDD